MITTHATPRLHAATGLSLVNPITFVAERTGTEAYAEIEVLDRNDNVIATLRATFRSDNYAYFDVSEIVKSLFNRYTTPPPLAAGGFYVDDINYFTIYKIKLGTYVFTGRAILAGTIYNDFEFTRTPINAPRVQNDFERHVIYSDDLIEPYYFLVDFEELDYNASDFN